MPGETTKRLIQGAIKILTDTFNLSAETCSVPLPVLLDYRKMYVEERIKVDKMREKARFYDHTVQTLQQELQECRESSRPPGPANSRKRQATGTGDSPIVVHDSD